jgi:DNA (cytosine-5)-methyltransferase 1
MGLEFGSVCSGIEAASVAWLPLGWRAVWLAEIDKAASKLLAHRFPDVVNHGDMTKLAGMVRRREIAAPDVLCGGTPCQSYSIAGRRLGLADPRGQLTIAFIDLADAIDEVRRADGKPPCIIIWENVPGVLTSKDNAFGCFLAGLAGEDSEIKPAGRKWTNAGCVLGPERSVAWRTLDAQFFGLAQRRRRVFVIASARDGFDPAAILFEREGVRRDSPPSREAGQDVAGTLDARTDGGGFPGTDGACSGHVVPACRVHGTREGQIGGDFDSLLGGERVRQPADVLTFDRQSSGEYGDASVASTIAARDYKSASDLIVQPVAFSSKDYGGDAIEDLSPTLRAGGHTESHANAGVPPAVAYAFQPRIARNGRGDMGDIVNALTAQAGETGKGDAAPCVAYAIQERAVPQAVCVTGEVTHTLKADGFDASEDGTGRGQPIVPSLYSIMPMNSGKDYKAREVDIAQPLMAGGPTTGNQGGDFILHHQQMAVRRLMPVECERLQGFPDGWTDIPIDEKGKRAADGPRYKQLGNSWAVTCVRWIGRRVDAHVATLDRIGHNGGPPLDDEFDALLAA